MFCVIYLTNDGLIRGYTFIGIFLGVLLYLVGLSPAVIKSSLFVINLVKLIIKKIIWLISIPIVFIIKIFTPIFRAIKNKGKSTGKRINEGRKFYMRQTKKKASKLKSKIIKKKP